MRKVIVVRTPFKISILETDKTWKQMYEQNYAGILKTIMTINADSTYIGTKPITEISDEVIVELFVQRLGYSLLTKD